MDIGTWINAVFALVFVLALIGLTNVVLRRYGPDKLLFALQNKKGAKRLSVEETLVLDSKRRIVLVKCDKTEHLILLGLNGELLIPKPTKKSDA